LEATVEILEDTLKPFVEDLKRHLGLGLEVEALEICRGLELGCYRLSEPEGGEVLGWAPDFPACPAGDHRKGFLAHSHMSPAFRLMRPNLTHYATA
jgi:hypothetical protein